MVLLVTALAGCGGDSGKAHQPLQTAVPAQAPAPGLIRSPPIARLAAEQLRSLSMDCQKYSPDKSSRGPYDAAYCEEAIAAWSDSPLQMLPLIKEVPPQNSPLSHQ